MKRFFYLKKIKKIFLFFFISGLIAFVFCLINDKLRIREIKIITEGSKTVINGIYLLKNKNILFLNKEEITQLLLKNNPHISSIEIEKKLPDKLIIFVSLEKIDYVLKADKGFFLINKKGKIIKKTKFFSNSLPIVNFYQTLYFDYYSIGDIIKYNDILLTLKIIEEVLNLGYKVNTVDIAGKDMVLFKIKTSNEEKNIYFSLEKDINTQCYQLGFLLKQLRIRNQVFKEIDLRFKEPLIKN